MTVPEPGPGTPPRPGSGAAPRRTVTVVVEDPRTPEDVARLCTRLRWTLESSGADVAICDVGALAAPDLGTVEALARVLLTARRLDRDVRLRGASAELLELLELAGLDGLATAG